LRLISDQIERELDSQERQPFNIRAARTALERALTYQLAILADGVLGWLILHGQQIDEARWRAACLTHFNRVGESDGRSLEDCDEDVSTFKKSFIQQIATRRVKAINPSQLNELELRIYGKYVPFYNEPEINRQLAKLGSAFRMVVPGAQTIIVNEVINQFELAVKPHKVDARFIFGQVSHCTAMPYAQLFDFEREVALSPLVDPGGAGFTYDDKIVIRHLILMGLARGHSQSSQVSEKVPLRNWVDTLIHESIHTFGGSGLSWSAQVDHQRHPYAKAGWLDDTRRDICRFTETPRSMDSLREVFRWNFENFLLLKGKDLPDTFVGVNLREMMEHFTLEHVLEEMRKERLIVDGPDGCLYSPIYEDGREWYL
jgi:hypothetical protein